jgi:hypothetical protein
MAVTRESVSSEFSSDHQTGAEAKVAGESREPAIQDREELHAEPDGCHGARQNQAWSMGSSAASSWSSSLSARSSLPAPPL